MPQLDGIATTTTTAPDMTTRARAADSASVTGSSTSDESTKKRKRQRRDKKNAKRVALLDPPAASTSAAAAINDNDAPASVVKNGRLGAFDHRRTSLSKAARDPRDEPPPSKKKVAAAAAASASALAAVKPREPSPVIDYDGLSRPSRGTRERREENADEAEQRLVKMRGAVRTLLECIGEDPDREGLLDTPSRYAKALMFLTKGYQVNVEDIVNNALFNEGHRELIIVKDIEVFSLCEHHMVPFTGKMHIGYIPSNTVIGLSKLPRIAEMYARRLQIQERLTKEVANAIMEILKPQGVAVVMESSHLCMVTRGVEKTSTKTITSCVLGCFERKSKTRNEFFSLVGLSRR